MTHPFATAILDPFLGVLASDEAAMRHRAASLVLREIAAASTADARAILDLVRERGLTPGEAARFCSGCGMLADLIDTIAARRAGSPSRWRSDE